MPAPLRENRTNVSNIDGARQFAHMASAAAARAMIEESMKRIDGDLLKLHSMYHEDNLGNSKAARELEQMINLEARTSASLIITYEKGMSEDGSVKYSLDALNKRITNAAKAIYGENWSNNVYNHDISAIHKAKGHIRAAVEEHQPGDDAAMMLSRLEAKLADQLPLLFNTMGLDPEKYSEVLSNLADLKHTIRYEGAGESQASEQHVGQVAVAQLGKNETTQLTPEEINKINENLKNFGKQKEEDSES